MLDEVAYYQNHHWSCPRCGHLVRRAMNRPPQEADCWRRAGPACADPRCGWHVHLRHCGGTYVKVKEPEGYKPKTLRREEAGKQQAGEAVCLWVGEEAEALQHPTDYLPCVHLGL